MHVEYVNKMLSTISNTLSPTRSSALSKTDQSIEAKTGVTNHDHDEISITDSTTSKFEEIEKRLEKEW